MLQPQQNTFDNSFNLVNGLLSDLEITENNNKDNCYIRDKASQSLYYKTFILDENSKTKIICDITFYKSSVTSKYLPRLIFKKIDIKDIQKQAEENKDIISLQNVH